MCILHVFFASCPETACLDGTAAHSHNCIQEVANIMELPLTMVGGILAVNWKKKGKSVILILFAQGRRSYSVWALQQTSEKRVKVIYWDLLELGDELIHFDLFRANWSTAKCSTLLSYQAHLSDIVRPLTLMQWPLSARSLLRLMRRQIQPDIIELLCKSFRSRGQLLARNCECDCVIFITAETNILKA